MQDGYLREDSLIIPYLNRAADLLFILAATRIAACRPSSLPVSANTRVPLIAVVDYGAGNLRSVAKALEGLNFRVTVTDEAANLNKADGVVFPGAGHRRSGHGASTFGRFEIRPPGPHRHR